VDETRAPQSVGRFPRPSENLVERHIVRIPEEYGGDLSLPVDQDGYAPAKLVRQARNRPRQLQRYYFSLRDFPSVKAFETGGLALRKSGRLTVYLAYK
jgi:hypothetical protein